MAHERLPSANTTADIALVAYGRIAREGGFDLSGQPRLRAGIVRCDEMLGEQPGSLLRGTDLIAPNRRNALDVGQSRRMLRREARHRIRQLWKMSRSAYIVFDRYVYRGVNGQPRWGDGLYLSMGIRLPPVIRQSNQKLQP